MSGNEEKMYGTGEQKKKTVYDFIYGYASKKYELRYDELGHEFQISFKGKNIWEILDVNCFLFGLAQSDIQINPAKLEIYLRSRFVQKFNPIEAYFKSVPNWPREENFSPKST